MGTERHGRRRARWLVPAVAVAGAMAAAGARAARARRAASESSPARERAGATAPHTAAEAPHDRPHLPTRQPLRPGAVTPAPSSDAVDVAARALTALSGSGTAAPSATASSAPAPEAAATATTGGDTLTAAPQDDTDAPPGNGASGPATPSPTPAPAPAPSDARTATNGAGTGATTPTGAARVGPMPDPPAPAPILAPPAATGRGTRRLAGLRRHRLRLVAGVVVIGIGLGAAAAVAGVDTDDGGASTDPTTTTATSAPSTTTSVPITAESIFPAAAQRLAGAGTFRYTGTVSASDVSHIRPLLWVGVDTTVDGEVSVDSAAVHEVATATDGGVSETVAVGQQVWGRQADDAGALREVPYATVPELSTTGGTPPARGAVLLPALLLGATAPAEQGLDDAGRRTFTATLPAELLGPVERGVAPVDARLVLSVDDTGAPVQVEIDTESLGGPLFRVVLELGELGAPVRIAPPA